MDKAYEYLKDLKCLSCSHARLCFKNKGGADLTLASQDCEDFDLIEKRGTVLKGTWQPKEVMIRDINAKNYSCSVCGLEHYVTNYCPNCGAEMNYCTVSSDYVHTAIPNKFWILFDVPGFYDIKEYEVDKVVYEKGVLDRLWGHNDTNRVVAFAADFDKIVFFSEEKAKAKLSAILQHR